MTLLNPAPTRQLSLSWDAEPRALAHHLAEWTTGSAVSAGIAELAVESISGQNHVLDFLKPKAINAHRTYGGAMPMNEWARTARKTFARPCQGGWLALGHSPLEDGRLVPITFKPDKPRQNEAGDLVKYERPAGSAPVPYFAPLDAAAYQAIAARAGLTPPAFVTSWSAWCWLLAQPAVELCIDEGEKKAAAACSHGFLTIGLAGIWNGAPRPKDASGQPFGAPTLLAELQWLRGVRPAGAPLTIAFDASEKPRGRIAIRKARRLLGRLLTEQGHSVRIREMVQPAGAAGFVKGTDDLLVHGGADALSALPVLPFEQWQKQTSQQAIRDHLLHPFKTKHRKHQTIGRHFTAGDLPASPLVALIGGMGSGKTSAIAAKAGTSRLVSITHRRSLADNQGQRFGLAVKREGKVLHALEQQQSDLRQVAHLLAEHEGFVTVIDSSYIGGSGEITPEQCRGAVLFIDEADAFLRHCLMARTHIERHRCEVLTNLAACVAAADQVVLAGAHIDETTLLAFEAMRGNGTKAHIIESTLLAAAGREVTMHRTVDQLLQQLRNLATHRQPFIFHTGSKETGSKMAPGNLARLVRRWWPDARVLEMTSQTIREPDHAAAAAVEDPQMLLSFDVVIATPVLETGFSIEDPHQHFAAVLGHTAGHTVPTAFVQSLGRLRSNVTRHIWCNHTGTKIGNGAPVVDELERSKLQHAIAVAHLVDAGEATGDAGRFLRWWSELAADQNWLASNYRHAVATLLEREGYGVQRLDQQAADSSTELVELLDQDRDAAVAEDTAAVAAAPAPDADQLELLESRQRLTADQRRQLERGRIERDLGIKAPTAKQVEISRKNSYGKALLHLLTIDASQRQRWEQETLAAMPASVHNFAPDFAKAMAPATRATLLSKMQWLLELLDLAGTGQTITMADFEQHHEAAKAMTYWRELLGFDPHSGTCRTFVANMLALLGFKLQRTSRRSLFGERRYWHYEVVDELAVLDRQQVLQRLACGHFACK